jgi:NADPH-ferrihemoprotein reductase
VVFWGSQSGTAEGFAIRLAKDCKSRFGVDTIAADISNYDPESISKIPKSKLAIFIVSTYGDGDPSDNTSQFLAWLGENKMISFPNLRYTAFGLGNSKYKYYNKVVDVLTTSLNELHATPVFDIGKADDSNGATEDNFTQWKQDLFSAFKRDLGYREVSSHYEPNFKVVEDESLAPIDLLIGDPLQPRGGKNKGMPSSLIQPLSISKIKKLYSSPERGCLHVEVDLTNHPELKYTTGDHLAIWPSNPTSEIERLLSVLGCRGQKDTPLLITSLDPSVPSKIPSPTTLEVLFRYYLEICRPLSRETISTLIPFAPSPAAAARLTQLSQDKIAFHHCFSQIHNTLANILESVVTPDQSWSSLPLSLILETLPCLAPRYYSISSSSIVEPRSVTITAATSTTNKNGEPIPGVTTNYLLAIEHWFNNGIRSQTHSYEISGPNNALGGNSVYAHIQRSKFRLPAVLTRPIIMIASGTGIAPFRGFLQERVRLARIGKDVGRSLLFFGCQDPEQFLYQEELDQIVNTSKGSIEMLTAFSRQEPKKYVQDRIEAQQEKVAEMLIESDGYLYICGAARMARGVTQRLESCLRARMSWDEMKWKAWLERMKKEHRWQEDVWR